MPIIFIGNKRLKVACGPCIRGHRSSKCAHKDRVLVEVRKAGRPLATCPHPPGKCECERVVVNYMIPKDREGPAKVQKSTQAPRSVATLSQSEVEKVILGDPAALAVLASYPPAEISTSSDSSTPPPSTASSSSTTPRIDALQGVPYSQVVGDSPRYDHGQNTWLQNGWRDLYNAPSMTNTIEPQSQSIISAELASCCCSTKPEETPDTSQFPAIIPPLVERNSLVHHQNLQHGPESFADPLAALQQMPPPRPDANYDQSSDYAFPSADFLSLESNVGCGGMQTGTGSMPQRMMSGDGLACRCGDSCDCFACMTHPNNRKTVNYVRYHNNLLSRNGSITQEDFTSPQLAPSYHPTYTMPLHFDTQAQSHHVQPQPSQGIHGYLNSISLSPLSAPWQQEHHHTDPTTHIPVVELESLHPPITSSAMPEIIFQSNQGTRMPFEPPGQHGNVLSDHQSSTTIVSPTYDAESPLGEDASMLSPSSFLLQQFIVSGCDDITGTCQCGDGCNCPGCLTHSGHHNGLADSLQIPDSRDKSFADHNDYTIDYSKTEKRSCCS